MATCVNILPGVRSMYVWNDSLQSEAAGAMIIKSATGELRRLRDDARRSAPHELPEAVALEIADRHHPYLQWLADPRF